MPLFAVQGWPPLANESCARCSMPGIASASSPPPRIRSRRPITTLPLDLSPPAGTLGLDRLCLPGGPDARQAECSPALRCGPFSDVHFAYSYRRPFVANLHHSFRQRLSILDSSPRATAQRVYYYLAQRLAERPAVERAAGLLAVSSAVRDKFVGAYGVAPDRVTLAPYGIDTAFFARPPRQASSYAGAWLSKRTRRCCCSSGSLLIVKGWTISPVRSLRSIQNHASCWLGAGRTTTARTFCTCWGRPLIRSSKPATSPTSNCQPTTLWLMSSVSPSLMEGFGLTLAEALACETPVVAAEAGSVAEVVGPGGFWCRRATRWLWRMRSPSCSRIPSCAANWASAGVSTSPISSASRPCCGQRWRGMVRFLGKL